jgi:hypothetical protein
MEGYSVCCRAHEAATRTREIKMRYCNSKKRKKGTKLPDHANEHSKKTTKTVSPL